MITSQAQQFVQPIKVLKKYLKKQKCKKVLITLIPAQGYAVSLQAFWLMHGNTHPCHLPYSMIYIVIITSYHYVI